MLRGCVMPSPTRLKNMLQDKLYLIGPMGAGKTTVGRRLAAATGWPFYDSDHEIERRTGVDIPLIFEKEGESGFRRREAAVIDELTCQRPAILASGGGAVLEPVNRTHLHDRGFVIYLNASVEQQVMRTARSTHRPLLQNNPDPRKVLTALLAVRDPLYREVAHHIVLTDGRNARAISREILDHLRFGQQTMADDHQNPEC